jgi:hypothetical protein
MGNWRSTYRRLQVWRRQPPPARMPMPSTGTSNWEEKKARKKERRPTAAAPDAPRRPRRPRRDEEQDHGGGTWRRQPVRARVAGQQQRRRPVRDAARRRRVLGLRCSPVRQELGCKRPLLSCVASRLVSSRIQDAWEPARRADASVSPFLRHDRPTMSKCAWRSCGWRTC